MRIDTLIRKKTYEQMVFLLRRHPLIFARTVILFLALLVMPFAIYDVLVSLYPDLLLGIILGPVLVLIASVFLLFIWLLFYSFFMDYYLDTWIVTNDRIVNVEQEGLFARTISELDLYKIQDVTSEVKGIFATFFKYGNVYIQTAGERQRFVFEQVPNPHAVREKIIDLIAEDRKYHQSLLPQAAP